MKFFFFTSALLSLLIQNLLAEDMQKKVQEQNVQIVKLSAKEMSKNLPQKIDKYTILQNIKGKGTVLVYNFTINNQTKSDASIQKEDHKRMQKAVTKGLCKSSKRFLQSGIGISYIYSSAKSKKLLFRFNITKDNCHYSALR